MIFSESYLDIKNLNIQMSRNGVHIWLLMWKATRALETHAHASLRGLEMCPSDFAVLEALLHKGPLAVNVLGKKVLLTSGSMTAAVDRLEKRGLVERRDDPLDRRSWIVHLTPGGRELIGKLFAQHAADMERPVAVLSKGEVATLTALLRKLGRGAERKSK